MRRKYYSTQEIVDFIRNDSNLNYCLSKDKKVPESITYIIYYIYLDTDGELSSFSGRRIDVQITWHTFWNCTKSDIESYLAISFTDKVNIWLDKLALNPYNARDIENYIKKWHTVDIENGIIDLYVYVEDNGNLSDLSKSLGTRFDVNINYENFCQSLSITPEVCINCFSDALRQFINFKNPEFRRLALKLTEIVNGFVTSR